MVWCVSSKKGLDFSHVNWGGFPFFFIGLFLIPSFCVTAHDLNSLLFVFTKYKTSWHLDYFLEQLHCWKFVFLFSVPRLCGITRFLQCPCPSPSSSLSDFFPPWSVVPFWYSFMPNAMLLVLFSHLLTSMLDDSGYRSVPQHSDRILAMDWKLEQ